jgi:PAS domain S-box-containing protein
MTELGDTRRDSFSAEELLDLTHDAIMVRDLDFTIRYWNRAAQKIYGFTRDEVLGRKSEELLQTQFPAALLDIETEFLLARSWEGELVRQTRDKKRVVVACRWVLRTDSGGRPSGVLETSNDITLTHITDRYHAAARREPERFSWLQFQRLNGETGTPGTAYTE